MSSYDNPFSGYSSDGGRPLGFDKSRLDEIFKDKLGGLEIVPTDSGGVHLRFRPHQSSWELPTQTPPSERTVTDVASLAIFDRISPFDRVGALRAEHHLMFTEGFGFANLRESKRMLDFGAGSGGPTAALKALAELNGGIVEAVEVNPGQGQKIIENGVLPAERVHIVDGLKFMNAPEQQERFDLITAFMLGPDHDGTLCLALLSAARRALAETGVLVVSSDANTVMHFMQACQSRNVRYGHLLGIDTDTVYVGETVVVPRSSLGPTGLPSFP